MVGQADELVADDLVREPEPPLEVVEAGAVAHELEDDVGAVVLVVDLVGEASLAPQVDGLGLAGPLRRSAP